MKKINSLFAALLFTASYSAWAAEGTIEIWAWNINVPLLEKAAEEYKKENPKAEIRISDISTQDVYTKLSIGLQAKGKGLADVILIEDTHIRGFFENWPSNFTNLSALGYNDNEKYFPAFKVALNKMDGNFYGMPFDAGPVGVFYRPSIFKEAGIEPSTIETWDDYIKAGEAIREKTGAYMTDVRTDEDILVRAMIGTFNTHYFDIDGNIAFNSPEMIEAILPSISK